MDTPESVESPAEHSINMGYVVQATIISVDGANHTVEVGMDNVQGAMPDIQIASLYCHPAGGEGVYFMPEPGATCFLCVPSDGSRPFVYGYVMPPTDIEGDAGGRESLNPGDIVLSTRDDNKVILRRGGVVEIGSTALAQRLYIPLTNFIRDFFENYEALSLLGKISWTHEEVSLTETGTKVHYVFESKEKVEDVLPKFRVEVSEDTDVMPELYLDTEGGSEFGPKLSFLRVKVDSDDHLTNNYVFQASKAGDMFIKTGGYLLFETTGTYRVHSRDSIEFLGPLYSNKVNAAGSRTEKLSALEVESTGVIIEKARVSISLDSPQVNLGSFPAVHPTVKGDALYAMLVLWSNAIRSHGIPASMFPRSALLSSKVRVS